MFRVLVAVYAAVALAVQLVEDAKDGQSSQEAREQAIARVHELLTAALGYYPWWLPDALVGALIDRVVSLLHEKGIFAHAEPAIA
jgi:hypothetical protein